ncbi:MAG: diguanylate cyclase [Oxalobacteraceae bacterium]|nr:MAG: diguanylate cyclase [Oxalobacteraceae bacterium]
MTDTDSTVYKTLLESTKAIPWKIDWDSLRFAYIGPQIEALLGWTPESWQSVEDWATRIHPEDRETVVKFCVEQSKNGVDHEADYRALTRDGQYVWIRDVVHVVRDATGKVDCLVGFMFDITEQKKTEEKLLTLQKQLEQMSYTDGLTGVPNRRMFDTVWEREWASAQRAQSSLSLVLLDIDYFKQYNDRYGHLQGDECLKRIGQVLEAAGKRARDMFARFGGEEFVLIMPDTDANAALLVAERLRSLILQDRVAHEDSPVEQILTISLGVGTIVPSRNACSAAFLETVDQQLYRAKRNGRNQVAAG